MSRAVSVSASRRLLAVATVVACCLSPIPVWGDRAPDIIDGVGLLDFRDRPLFHVGSWVRYHTVGSSLQGLKSDYTVTILIAGEEVCWGDPCVWVETWLENAGGTSVTATLVSYSAFGDTMAYRHPGWFLRKSINGMGENGALEVALSMRQKSEFQRRKVDWDARGTGVVIDTLGTESVTIPLGTFQTTRVLHTQAASGAEEEGDSTTYYQHKEHQTHYLSRQIPITGLVKMDIDDIQQGKSWAVGRYNRDSLKTLERAMGTTTLVAQGRGDLTPRLVPPALRYPIADRSLVERVLRMPSEPTVRVLRPGGSP